MTVDSLKVEFHRMFVPRMCLAILLAPILTGCASPRVWIEETQTIRVAAEQLESLEIQSHNGDISMSGDSAATELRVVLKARFGGVTTASAEACKAAVEIASETLPGGQHRILSKWLKPKAPDWQLCTEFTVVGPPRLVTTFISHNGNITLKDVTAATQLTTHNGNIIVKSESPSLQILTHNGDIDAVAPAKTVHLESHNGNVRMNASASPEIGGEMTTHNGTIIATFSERTATRLSCRTHNGRIRWSIPWNLTSFDRRSAEAVLADGDSQLTIESHNGNIVLQK
ncbi:MAG: DUF4097 family beta strand repeat protein [Phycisphaerae bacterium]|nr:DUF4097 family beta strand repeat protein [Phycisphaerae bacterium]